MYYKYKHRSLLLSRGRIHLAIFFTFFLNLDNRNICLLWILCLLCVLWGPGKHFVCTYLIWSQGPVLGDKVHQGEGHGEGAQEDVRDGEVGNEDVPGGEHHL